MLCPEPKQKPHTLIHTDTYIYKIRQIYLHHRVVVISLFEIKNFTDLRFLSQALWLSLFFPHLPTGGGKTTTTFLTLFLPHSISLLFSFYIFTTIWVVYIGLVLHRFLRAINLEINGSLRAQKLHWEGVPLLKRKQPLETKGFNWANLRLGKNFSQSE